MLDTERRFIEGAARALWCTAWADREEHICRACGQGTESPAPCKPKSMPEHMGGFAAHHGRSFSQQKIEEIAPPTPEYVRLEAARSLGKVEQANELEISAIMAAAAKAIEVENGERGYQLDDEHQEEFGWCVAMQAIGTGVAWTDSHAEVRLPSANTDYQTGRTDVPFRVPSVEFTYLDLED